MFHVVSVYYKYGHSDIASFQTEGDLREFLLSEHSVMEEECLNTPNLIDAIIRRESGSDNRPEWCIVAVFQGTLICSGTTRGFA